MKNLNAVKSRFLKEPFNRKIGHLASDLNRISVFLENPQNMQAINDILEESKFFAEWIAPEASFSTQELLCGIQSNIALCHYRILQKKTKADELEKLKQNTKNWSANLIQISGLA